MTSAKNNEVYLYNSSLEYVQTAKSWSEAARISGANSYKTVYKYLDSGELVKDNWYFFSKKHSSERIEELRVTKDAEDAELIPISLANESYQEIDTAIYLYICNDICENRSYELVKVTENILEAANFLNTSCKLIERNLDTNKLIKIGNENKYLAYSKPMGDEEDDDTEEQGSESGSSGSEPRNHLPLPESDFLHSIRRFAANHYTNVFPIPEIFGQMDETALLTISILLQEYLDQITYT